jgi:hypothetical protein
MGIPKKNFTHGAIEMICKIEISKYCLVPKSNHPLLVLKGVTEMSFLVLKIISRNSEEDQYFILPNCSLDIKLQYGNIEY